MAVTRVRQREIVELPYALPNGRILTHMGLVISRDELQDIVTHIVNVFKVDDVVNRYNNFVKDKYFDRITDKIFESIIG